MMHFIGSFRAEALPNNANVGDIAQIRLNKDQVYRDGYGNLACDKDLVVLTDDGCWNKYGVRNYYTKNYIMSIIKGDQIYASDMLELTNDELNTILKIADGFKELEINLISVDDWKYVINSKERDLMNKCIDVIKSKYKLY